MPTPERRSFRAETLEEALRLVSDELGPDAIVVRQREGVIGGVGGFFGRRCVEASRWRSRRRRRGPRSRDCDWAPSPDWVAPRPRVVPAGLVVDLYDTGSRSTEAEERYGWPIPDEPEQRFVPLIPEPIEEPTARPAAVQASVVPEPPEPPEPAAEPAPTEPAALVEPAAAAPEPAPEPAVELEIVEAAEPAPEPAVELELVEEPEDEGELMRTLLAQAAPFTEQFTTAYERTAFGRRLADAGLGDRLARDIVAEAETELRVFDPTQPFEDRCRRRWRGGSASRAARAGSAA